MPTPSTPASGRENAGLSDRLAAELAFISLRRKQLKAEGAIDAVVPEIAETQSISTDGVTGLQLPDIGQDDLDLTGLALSGGGLRSASVCLGALQGLNSVGMLDRMDYLSTVSGGNYIGGSYIATSHATKGKFCFDTQQGMRPSTGPKTVGDTPAVQHLRDHSNFLTPRGIGDLLQDIALVVRGLITSAFVIAPYVLLAAILTILLYSCVTDPVPHHAAIALGQRLAVNWLYLSIAITASFVFWSMMRADPAKSEFSGWSARLFSMLLVLIAAVAFLWVQHWMLEALLSQANGVPARPTRPSRNFLMLLQSALIASPPVALIIAFFRDQLVALAKSQGSRLLDVLARYGSRVTLLVGAIILPLILWLLYLNVVEAGLARILGVTPPTIDVVYGFTLDRITVILAIAAILGLFAAKRIGDNTYSLHGLYRDRLRQAFLEVPVAGVDGKLSETDVDDLALGFHPYPIFNTALNIQGSSQVNRRGRNADFFSFTPHFSGSPSTGYRKTVDIFADHKGMDLATVMAISGAAAAANMGVNSYRPMAFTLAALNIRLGFWLRNPSMRARRSLFSGFYLWNEMTSSLDETKAKVLLTDGGHVENLGVYELLRRRCKLIVIIDAEADPDMTFGSFYQLERFARIDLGARITIDLAPISAHTRAKMAANASPETAAVSKGPHMALGLIHYDGVATDTTGNGTTGYLLYFKSSLTGDEPDYVRDYARRNPAFPHESTADLFYSEEQFEAYRALGFHMVRRALHGDDDVVLPGPDGTSYLKKLDDGKAGSMPDNALRILAARRAAQAHVASPKV